MIRLKSGFLIIFATAFSACTLSSSAPVRNTKATRYPSGALRTMQEFINDTIQDGIYVRYYEDGALAIKKTYSINKRQGESTEYYKNGNTKSTVYYHADHEEGEARWYHENGALASWVIYEHGWKQSPGLTYYDTREFKAAIAYGDSNRVVYRIDYDKNGTILEENGIKPRGWDELVTRSRIHAESPDTTRRDS